MARLFLIALFLDLHPSPPPLSPEQLRDASVYTFVVKTRVGGRSLVLQRELDASFCNELGRRTRKLQPETLAGFVQANGASQSLEVLWPALLRRGWVVVARSAIADALGPVKDWERFRKTFGASRRVIVSGIGWNSDHTQAWLYLASDAGHHDGRGECLLYEYKRGKLALVDSVLVYDSHD